MFGGNPAGTIPQGGSQPIDENNLQPNQVLGPYYNEGLGPELGAHNGRNVYQLTTQGGFQLVGTVPKYAKIHSKSSSSSGLSNGSSSSSIFSSLSTTDYLIIGGGIILVIFLF